MSLYRNDEEGLSYIEASDILTKIIYHCHVQDTPRTAEEMQEAIEAIIGGSFFGVPGSENKAKCCVSPNRKVFFLKGPGLDEFSDFVA
ncbi:MAG TPA: hypothetical protein V6C91_00245 [Coleofasciculaceae cyanobacterium]